MKQESKVAGRGRKNGGINLVKANRKRAKKNKSEFKPGADSAIKLQEPTTENTREPDTGRAIEQAVGGRQ